MMPKINVFGGFSMGIDIFLFLVLGVFVGTFGTLVGIGGGLICVPIFIFFLSDGGIYPYFHTAAQITGTSLVIVLANALSGTLAYIRQRRVYFPAAVPFALATLPGAFLGSYIVDDFTGPMLYISFGAFLLLMASIMCWNATHKKHADVHDLPPGFTFSRSPSPSIGHCVVSTSPHRKGRRRRIRSFSRTTLPLGAFRACGTSAADGRRP